MTTITVPDIPLTVGSPAERLRRMAAAVRVHFTWWGVHRTLTSQQKEEVGDSYGADVRFLTAGKKIIDVRNETYRKLTSIRGRVVSYWRGLTLPYVESGVRLIRQSDIEPFVRMMEDFRSELTEGETELNTVFEQLKSDARRRLGRLYNPADYPPEVRGLFKVEWDFPAVEPPSYLMRLNADIFAQEQERVARRFEEAVQLAEQAFVGEFAKLVSHLTERLSSGGDGERRIFRDSVVTNLTEFFERFRHLNINSNAQLDQLVEQAQRLGPGRGTASSPRRRRPAPADRHAARRRAGFAGRHDDRPASSPHRSAKSVVFIPQLQEIVMDQLATAQSGPVDEIASSSTEKSQPTLLVFRPTGEIECLYTEVIDLHALGQPVIQRASHVEPDTEGQWWADLALVGGPKLGPHRRRTDALAAEREWLERWLVNKEAAHDEGR